MTGRATRADTGQPVAVDTAVRHVIRLLELVRDEEAVLRRLQDCADRLQTIHRSRAELLDVTDTELTEAEAVLAEDGAVGIARSAAPTGASGSQLPGLLRVSASLPVPRKGTGPGDDGGLS